MTEPKPPRPARRRNADYRWTKPKMLAFLRALAASRSVAQAARSVGMSRQSAYRLHARLGEGFGSVWDQAMALPLVSASAQGDAGRAQGDAPRAR